MAEEGSVTLTVTYDRTTQQLQYLQNQALPLGVKYIAGTESVFIVNGIQDLVLRFILVDETSQLGLQMLGMAAWVTGESLRPWIVLSSVGQCGPLQWATSDNVITLTATFPRTAGQWACRLAARVTGPNLIETIILDPKIYNEGNG